MPKNILDNRTGQHLLSVSDQDLQNMQDLVNQGELFGQGLATAQNILQSTIDDVRVTKSEYADILSILQQIANVGTGIGITIGQSVQGLESVASHLNRSIESLVKGDSTLKSLLRSTYNLENITSRLESVRIEGDLWQLKDLKKATRDLTKTETSIRRQGQRLGIPTDNLTNPDLAKLTEQEFRTYAVQASQAFRGVTDLGRGRVSMTDGTFNRLPAEIQSRLSQIGYSTPVAGERWFKKQDLDKLLTELKEVQVVARELVDIGELRNELEEERITTEQTLQAVGSRRNTAGTFAAIAQKLKLGSAADEITSLSEEATSAAKIHLTTNKGDIGGAQEAFDKIFSVEKATEILKNNFVESYLHLKKWGGPLGVALILATAIWKTLLNFDKQAVETKRVIGQWADATAVANFKFVTGTEVLKTMVQLGQQFKINPVQVFSPEELARITRAQKFTGMTAEAAGNLATQSKISGKNADTYRDAIAKGASSANALNHSATNLSAVQNDVLTTSRAIALSYGNNAEALARASGAAASLGMNLQDVENISKNLMNFQTSIESEMQAQLLTGMQLNLSRAREYALANNLEGVAREIKNQGMDAAKFSHMNYIQQDNMAKALGMSREQMSKMLIMQEINRLTAEQVAAMTNMRKEDIEALSAQEKWQTMKQKFLEALVPLLEPVLQILTDIMRWTAPIVGAVGWLAKQISTLGGLIKEDNMLLRAIPSILAVVLVAGLKFAGVFAKIGKLAKGIGKGILSWIPGLGKARVAAQATEAVFDQRLNRGRGGWRDVKSGRIVKAPADVTKNITKTATKTAPVTAGTSKLGKSFSSLGKNMGTILKGAAAMTIMSVALIGFAAALRIIPKGKEAWNALGVAIIGLAALTGAVILLGTIATGAGPVILAGAAAMILMAGAVAVLGLALKVLSGVDWKGFEGIGKAMWGLASAGIAAMVAGPALLVGATPLLAGSLALLAASYPLKQGLANLSAVPGSELKLVAEGITAIAGSVGDLVVSLESISLGKLTKLATLGKVFGALKGSQIYVEQPKVRESVQIPTEELQENLGVQKENIEASVQEIAIKQAQAQASAQQISIEQKATDLTRIERKMDELAKVFVKARPDWDWLKFDLEYSRNVPGR